MATKRQERIDELKKEIEILENEEKNELIEKLKKQYKGKCFQYENEFFKILDVEKVYDHEDDMDFDFDLRIIEMKIFDNGIEVSEVKAAEFGTGHSYSEWKEISKKKLDKIFDEKIEQMKNVWYQQIIIRSKEK